MTSVDGIAANFYPFDIAFLGRMATRSINEVSGVSRVVYDVTSKPPGMIEWEWWNRPRNEELKGVCMAKATRKWMWVKVLSPGEKAAIAAECGRFIAETLKPRFLPAVRPNQFNYPVDFLGKWRGSKYSFITRYRSGNPDNLGEEFESAFTRLDHVEENPVDTRFNVMSHRHTGQWFRLHSSVKLEEALRLMETDEMLYPL